MTDINCRSNPMERLVSSSAEIRSGLTTLRPLELSSLDGRYHVAVTYDGVGGTGSLKLYINGVQQTFTLQQGSNFMEPSGPIYYSGNYPLNMGRRAGDGLNPYNGLADEVQIFNRVLTASEILAIYNAGSHGLCPQAHFGNPMATPPVPTLMGVSIGNTPGCNTSVPPLCYEGTAGLLVHSMNEPDRHLILSNNHVLGAVGPTFCPGTATPGEWTLQPGTGDIPGGDPHQNPFYHVGWVDRFWPLSTSGHNVIDAAISDTDLSLASTSVFGIGQPTAAIGSATVGETVVKTGRTTAVTTGTVTEVFVAGTVCWQSGILRHALVASTCSSSKSVFRRVHRPCLETRGQSGWTAQR